MSGRLLRAAALAGLAAVLAACGGGSLGVGPATVGPGANVAPVLIDGGPNGGSVNTLYTSVTVCAPGSTTDCQTIDHIQVDTMSFGLRLLAQALTLSLPVTRASNGASLVECVPFADGYSWGPVAQVDVTIAGESAMSVPVQLIGDPRFPTVPADCSSSGPVPEDTVAAFGANGLLGIGPFAVDCGTACVNAVIPGAYYSCTAAACQGTTVVLTSQVANPVSRFAVDNNGSIITLPAVAAGGAATLSGSLIFGIDTQSNNQLSMKYVLTLDPATGNLTTLYKGQSLTSSFIDSGSNGYFFNDAALSACANKNFKGFYCPVSSAELTGVLEGQNGATASVGFTVGNIDAALTAAPTFAVFPEVGGTISLANTFDWGLPFFFGRPVATVLEGAATAAGTGPYVAF